MNELDFRAVFDALPSPFMVLDRDLCYVHANPAYTSVIMRPLEQLLGRNIFDLFPNEDDGGRRLRASFERVLETGERDTIAFIPYDIPRPDSQGGGFEQRYWTAIHSPIRDNGGKVTHVLQNTVDVTEMVRLQAASALPYRSVSGATDLLQRAREAEETNQRLLAESEDFRRLFQTAPTFIAVLSGPRHVFTFANDAYLRLVGDRNVVGMEIRGALPEIAGQDFCEMLDEVYQTGTTHQGEAARVMLAPPNGGPLVEHFLDFAYNPINDAEGRISGVLVQGADRTDHVHAERHQRILLDELNHRVKNTLATVQSIATQTFRNTDTPKAALDAFSSRLRALSQTHNILSRANWEGAQLGDLVRQELMPFDITRAHVAGPAIHLPARMALSLAMVLHELAANAARHGALSAPEGSVDVRWRLANGGGRPSLDLTWDESGGPSAPATRRPGFGDRLIRSSLEGELGGSTRSHYGPDGLQFELSVPMPALEAMNDNE